MRTVLPVSPGEMLEEEFLKPLGLTKYPVCPEKAQAPLTVDADAVLAFAIVFKSLETVSWRYLQVIENCGPIQLCELAKSRALNVDPTPYATPFKQGLGVRRSGLPRS